MKRTAWAFLIFFLTGVTIFSLGLIFKNECRALSSDIEDVLAKTQIEAFDIEKVRQKFYKRRWLFALTSQRMQSEEIEKELLTAERLLNSSDEELRSLLFSLKLNFAFLGKREDMKLINLL